MTHLSNLLKKAALGKKIRHMGSSRKLWGGRLQLGNQKMKPFEDSERRKDEMLKKFNPFPHVAFPSDFGPM